ncbi:MAG: hypothetical protein ACOCV8_05555 [Spirochaetota bacterium]
MLVDMRIRLLICLLFLLVIPRCLYSFFPEDTFTYTFSDKKIEVYDTFELRIEIIQNDNINRAVDFDREALSEKGFILESFDYSVIKSFNPEGEISILYELILLFSIKTDNIKSLPHIMEFPSFSISLIPIQKSKEIKIYSVGKEQIEIINKRSNYLFIIIIILSISIGLMIIIMFAANFVKKGNKKELEVEEEKEEISNNIYRRYIEKKEDFKKNKDTHLFLLSIEKLVKSYVLRSNNLTNLDEFFDNENISCEFKARIRNFIDKLREYYHIGNLHIHNEDFEKLEKDFKSILFSNSK